MRAAYSGAAACGGMWVALQWRGALCKAKTGRRDGGRGDSEQLRAARRQCEGCMQRRVGREGCVQLHEGGVAVALRKCARGVLAK